MSAVGEHAPSQATVGHVIDPAQIPQHLRRGDALFAFAARLFAIEHPIPTLRLDNAKAMLKPLPSEERRGLGLGVGIPE